MNSQGTTVSKRADPPAAPGTDTGTKNKGNNNSKKNESRLGLRKLQILKENM